MELTQVCRGQPGSTLPFWWPGDLGEDEATAWLEGWVPWETPWPPKDPGAHNARVGAPVSPHDKMVHAWFMVHGSESWRIMAAASDLSWFVIVDNTSWRMKLVGYHTYQPSITIMIGWEPGHKMQGESGRCKGKVAAFISNASCPGDRAQASPQESCSCRQDETGSVSVVVVSTCCQIPCLGMAYRVIVLAAAVKLTKKVNSYRLV